MWKKAELKDRKGPLFLPTPHPCFFHTFCRTDPPGRRSCKPTFPEAFALNPVSLYSLPSVFPLLWEPGGKALLYCSCQPVS